MFKDVLLDKLKDRNISQKKLSEETGIPTTTISGWINQNKLPDYNSLKKLSKFFGVSSDVFLELEDDFGNKKYFVNIVNIKN